MSAKMHRQINLIPKEDFERTTLGRIMKWALTTFRFIVIIVEFVVIGGFLFRFYLDVQISNLDDEIQQKSALISSKSSFEKEFRSTQARIGIYKQISSDSNKSLPSFEQIAQSLPSDTQLVSFTRQKNVLDLVGETLNEASIARFLESLEEKEGFASVDLTQIKTEVDSPVIEFRVQIALSGGGA
jgi:Tfp pilus assembly protein PilN